MAQPDSVPACIKALSNQTFVAEVTSPALAVLVPLLQRALNDRSMEVQRRTVVVITNFVKLVRDPRIAAKYLSSLVDGVEKIATGAAFPEVRAFAQTALDTLLKSGASKAGPPPEHRDIESERAESLAALHTLLPEDISNPPATANGPRIPKYSLLDESLKFQAQIIAELVHKRTFDNPAVWQRSIGLFMGSWLSKEQASAFSESVRSHLQAVDHVGGCSGPLSTILIDYCRRSTTSPLSTTLTKANPSVIPSSPWLTVPFSFSLTPSSDCSADAVMVSLAQTGLGSLHSCVSCEMGKLRTSPDRTRSSV